MAERNRSRAGVQRLDRPPEKAGQSGNLDEREAAQL